MTGRRTASISIFRFLLPVDFLLNIFPQILSAIDSKRRLGGLAEAINPQQQKRKWGENK